MASMGRISDMSGLTLEISVTRMFYVRKAIGLLLIRLACRVMRCDVKVNEERTE